MTRTIEISDETFEKIKEQLGETDYKEIQKQALQDTEARVRRECADYLEEHLDLGLRVGMPKTYFEGIITQWRKE